MCVHCLFQLFFKTELSFSFFSFQDILEACLLDRRSAWELHSNGRYRLLGQRPGTIQFSKLDKNTSLLAHAEVVGLHKACMDLVSRQVLFLPYELLEFCSLNSLFKIRQERRKRSVFGRKVAVLAKQGS